MADALRKLMSDFYRARKRTLRKVGNRAAYIAIALSRAPKRVKKAPPSKVPESLNSPNYRAYTLKLYYPNPNGGGEIDSGMTVGEYLKKIKGGYVARGAGKYQAHQLRFHESRNYRDPNFQMTPGSSYAIGLGSTRVTERMAKTHSKGTGRFSDTERKKLQRLRERQKDLQRQLWDADRSRSAKAYGRLVRENNRIRERLSRAGHQSPDKTAKARERMQANQRKYVERIRKMKAKREARVEKWKAKNLQYRIVATTKRQTLDPQPGGLLRKGSTPGQPPKTWAGGGRTNYYIGQREGATDEMTGKKKWVNNYLVEQVSDTEYRVTLKPLLGSSDSTLAELEYGGSHHGRPIIDGYTLTSRTIGSHRRVSFEKHKGDSKSINVAKRPWFSPTLEKVRQRFKQPNLKFIW